MADSTADSTQSEESENSNSENRTPLCSSMLPNLGSRSESETPSSTTNGSPGGTVPSGANPSSSSPQRNGGNSPQSHKLNMYRPGFTAFGGSGVNQGCLPRTEAGAFSNNPFAPRPGLRTDVVSTSHHHCSSPTEAAMIAPSRFGNPFLMRPSGESESDEEHGRRAGVLAQPRLSSVLAPSRLQLRPAALTLREEVPSQSQFSSPLLKPATLPDPTKQSPEGGKEAGKAASDEAHSTVPEGVCQGTEGAASNRVDSLPSPTSTNKASDDAAASGKENIGAVESGANAPAGFLFGEGLTERVSNVGASQHAGFVFGENLADRVVQSNLPSESEDEKYNSDDQKSDAAKTLEESAREYQARHGVKRDLKEVEVKTGEEEESNVLQAACKLFVFDGKDQRWVERGRGTLRLNDMVSATDEFFQSRLVMRTQGSLRVILNTKIWNGMMVERANSKSLRITASDGAEGIKVFLLMTNTNDNENILRAIDWRIQRLKCAEEKERHTEEGRRVAEKRHADSSDMESPPKRHKRLGELEGAAGHIRREESDSSVQDPETEASCESYSSSFTVRSESE